MAPGALVGALVGYVLVFWAFVAILELWSDPAPLIVQACFARFWASMTFSSFAIVLAEEIAPAGREHVSKWTGGILMAISVVMAMLGVALSGLSDLACAFGLVVGTFMTWAAEKRWR